MKTRTISDFIGIETYTVAGDLIVTKPEKDGYFIGRAYEMTPLSGGGGEFSTVVTNLFKTAPDNSVIQVSLLCYPDHEAAGIYLTGKTHGSPMVQELVKNQAKLITKAAQVGWQPDLPLLNQRTLLVTLAIPTKKTDEKAMSDAKEIQDEFLNSLTTSGFYDARTISASIIASVYRQFANPFVPRQIVQLDEVAEFKKQVFASDNSVDFSDRIGLFDDKVFCSTITVKAYPEQVSHGLMNLVVGAPFNTGTSKEGGGARIATPYILNTTIRVAQQAKELERIKNAILSRDHHNPLPFSLGDENAEDKKQDLLYLQGLCGPEDGEKIVNVSTTAFLFALDKSVAIQQANTFKGTLNKLGFDAREVADNGVVRWAQTLLLNFSTAIADQLENQALMPSSAAGCLLPIFGDAIGNARIGTNYSGHAFITRRGTPYFHDTFVSNSNYCGVISANSGSGKSFLLQYFMANDLAEGTNVFLIDNGRSSKKFCHAVGGEYTEFDLKQESRPSLNPFSTLSDADFDDQQDTITALFLMAAFEGEEKPQGGARIAMREAVRSAYGQRQKNADIGTVIDALDSIRNNSEPGVDKDEVQTAAANLVPRLKAFYDSPTRGTFFRGKSTINPKQQFTVFEISGLSGDQHLQRCVMFFVLNMLLTRIQSLQGRKSVYIDEGLDLIKMPTAADAIEGIYQKGRKDRASIVFVTQSLIKLTEFSAGKMILNLSAWKFILGQTKEEIGAAFATEALSSFEGDEYFKRLIYGVKTQKGVFSEILIINEDGYQVVRLYVPLFMATLFSSEGEARDQVFQLMNQGMDAVDAVRKVMGDEKTSRTTFIARFLAHLLNNENLTPSQIRAEVNEALGQPHD